jgi:hypothetical protein
MESDYSVKFPHVLLDQIFYLGFKKAESKGKPYTVAYYYDSQT